MMGGELAEFIDLRSAASIAPRRSAMDGSMPRCSSVPPTPRRNGTPSRRCSSRRRSPTSSAAWLLSGRAADGLAETGPVICACFGVGLNVIRDAIASNSATNVEAIGKALRAGTNCGSCLPELKRIVHEHAHAV